MSALQMQPIRVLLIEDDPADAYLLWEILSKSKFPSFEVRTVHTLREGIERLKITGNKEE